METLRTVTYSEERVERLLGIEINGDIVGKVNQSAKGWSFYCKAPYTDCCLRGNRFPTLIECKQAALLCYRSEYREEDLVERKTKRNTSAKSLPLSTDAEFYPTPANIAGKMIGFANWKEIETILEPSAGKGDLVEAVLANAHRIVHNKSHTDFWRVGKEYDIDCIERDENLRYILEGKKMRVVADDFLLYTTRKHYDLILMNPPFSNGDEHLLRAIEMQEGAGGQIVCLLNAETLRNPCTNRRKVLAQKLKKYGARIEYVKNGFLHAERPTDVTIAIVGLNIQKEARTDDIYSRMKRAYDKVMDDNGNGTELAPNNRFEALVRLYEIETAATFEFMEEYNSLISHILNEDDRNDSGLNLHIGENTVWGRIETDDVNRYMRIVREKYWHKLFQLPEITNRLTSDALRNWESRITELRDYEFSEFNVKRVMVELRGQLMQDVESAIMGLFEKLSCEHAYGEDFGNNIHYYNGWKTNKAHMVNSKVIIPAYGCFSSWGSGFSAWHAKDILADLEKSLDYLNGRKESDVSPMEGELNRAEKTHDAKNIRCKYFSVNFYKKGTCHIKFYPEAQHVLDALNIFAARHKGWLPPSYGKVRYNDMNQEERETVDEFQGRKAYDEVMDHPEIYLIEASAPMLMSAV